MSIFLDIQGDWEWSKRNLQYQANAGGLEILKILTKFLESLRKITDVRMVRRN